MIGPYEKLGWAVISQAKADFEDAIVCMHSAVKSGLPSRMIRTLRAGSKKANEISALIETYKARRAPLRDASAEGYIKKLEAEAKARDALIDAIAARTEDRGKAVKRSIASLLQLGEALKLWDDVMRFVAGRTCERYATSVDASALLAELIKLEMSYIRDGLTAKSARRLAGRRKETEEDG